MRIFDKAENGNVLIGSGYLYACAASAFDPSDFDVADMDDLGYIEDSAVFRRSSSKTELKSANKGVVGVFQHDYVTEFETGIISYVANHVANYLTGSQVTSSGDKVYTYFCESDNSPEIALVFVGTDEQSGDTFTLVMPKCVWNADSLELDFNNDNPVSINFAFKCLNVTLPNGKIGAAFIEQSGAAFGVGVSSVTFALSSNSPDIPIVGATGAIAVAYKNASDDSTATGFSHTISGDRDTLIITAGTGASAGSYYAVLTDTSGATARVDITLTAN